MMKGGGVVEGGGVVWRKVVRVGIEWLEMDLRYERVWFEERWLEEE